MKAVITKDATLAYPDYTQGYRKLQGATESCKKPQNSRPLVCFSCKLSMAQQKYCTIKQEPVAIVESIKMFKDMLWGEQKWSLLSIKMNARWSRTDLRLSVSLVITLTRVWPYHVHIKEIYNSCRWNFMIGLWSQQGWQEIFNSLYQCWCYTTKKWYIYDK